MPFFSVIKADNSNFEIKILAGIYIHIPYCKIKCHYCDFHFSTNQSKTNEMVDSLVKELNIQKDYLSGEKIETIYFGGGTPSILTKIQLEKIIEAVFLNFEVIPDFELTFECNPDDLSNEYLSILKKLKVNRLSIGIQSFDENHLKTLNRAHNSKEAENAIYLAKENGFTNLTIDLIYGLPNTDNDYWRKQVQKAISFNVPHISSYCLTYEDKTVFGNWLKKKKIIPLSDEASLDQFKILKEELDLAGYEHYEISNFAKENFISKHNSSYWLGKKYLGIGPSAHSFNGTKRQWNIANNQLYINYIQNDLKQFQDEELSENDQFNEYIMTRLRTKWGIEINYLKKNFPLNFNQIQPVLNIFEEKKQIIKSATHYYISDSGKFIVDKLTSDLFIV